MAKLDFMDYVTLVIGSNAMHEAKMQFKRMETILNILEKANRPMRPIEIAEVAEYFSYDEANINVSKVVNPLYWLESMGLVTYTEKEYEVEVEGNFTDFIIDEKGNIYQSVNKIYDKRTITKTVKYWEIKR